mgnify:CR=1 FL=1
MVNVGDDGYLMVSEPNPWQYVKAIQELNAKIALLEEQNKKLQAQEKRIKALEEKR